MSSRERNAALVREAVEAYNRDDGAAVAGVFDPAVELHVSGQLMNAGTWHGPDGLEAMLRGWGEAWSENVFEVLEVETPDDDHVVARIHQRAVGALSGVPVELSVHFLLEVRGGRAVRFHVYASREEALAAI